VVDNQSVQMMFENGVTATLQMNAFNQNSGRRVTLFGTYGMADMVDDKITLNIYGQPAELIDPAIQKMNEAYAHGGGDARMIDALYGMISGESPLTTSLEQSVESHLIGIRAEESRLEGGKLLLVHA